MRGRLITLAGIDGAGKSSHLESITQWLVRQGHQVVVTREPGGTNLAEHLRGLVLGTPMDGLTEALLVFAARRDHLRDKIAPALAAGFTVLSDRFVDCSFAFQGGGRGVDWTVLEQLEAAVLGAVRPDLTIWFDLPTRQAAERRGSRQADRFEAEDEDFHQRVRAGYQRRMDADPARFLRVDASQPREVVRGAVLEGLFARGL
jgi:dTMP kinase